ncbi:MAG: hypothetical protein J0M18_14030 [Ignavibacteria bacterium]|jgi:hypothetical protein|nr:hypothetical protein [Ignavibacteria bacterium]
MEIPAEITLRLVSINELLRLPVSLYRKRTLKSDAEEFIVEEAEALPHKTAINIKVNLASSEVKYKDDITLAIQRHFCYRRAQAQKRFKRVLHYGWRILFIALGLLAAIFSLTELILYLMPDNKLLLFIRESFIILGWVALWRPLDLLLYEWYPIKTNINLFYRLEHCNVHIIISES